MCPSSVRTSSYCIVLNRVAFYLVLTSSYCIAGCRVNSCQFLSHRCVFLSVRSNSSRFVLVLSTYSYYIVAHRFYIVSVLIGVQSIVARRIASYWFAPGKQYEPVRTDRNVIRRDTTWYEPIRIDTMQYEHVSIRRANTIVLNISKHSYWPANVADLYCEWMRSNTNQYDGDTIVCDAQRMPVRISSQPKIATVGLGH